MVASISFPTSVQGLALLVLLPCVFALLLVVYWLILPTHHAYLPVETLVRTLDTAPSQDSSYI